VRPQRIRMRKILYMVADKNASSGQIFHSPLPGARQ
jgi:hypothetical protein